MLLYCFACVFNVALDLITTYIVAYRINVARHKMSNGKPPCATLSSCLQLTTDLVYQKSSSRVLYKKIAIHSQSFEYVHRGS